MSQIFHLFYKICLRKVLFSAWQIFKFQNVSPYIKAYGKILTQNSCALAKQCSDAASTIFSQSSLFSQFSQLVFGDFFFKLNLNYSDISFPFCSPSAPFETLNLWNLEIWKLENSETWKLGNSAIFNRFQWFSAVFSHF